MSFNLIDLEAQSIPVPQAKIDCYLTLESWRVAKNLRDFVATHDCYCPSPTSEPVCMPRGSASAGIYGSSRSYQLPLSQQIQLMAIQGILQSALSAMMQSLLMPPPSGPTPEELRRIREEQLRKEAQERFEILSKLTVVKRQTAKNSQKERNKRLSSLLTVDMENEKDNGTEKTEISKLYKDAAGIFGNLVVDKTIEKIEEVGENIVLSLM